MRDVLSDGGDYVICYSKRRG